MTDYALRYAQALRKRPPRMPQDGRTGEGEGVCIDLQEETAPRAAQELTGDERDYFEERAAMRAILGGFPRGEAERLALAGRKVLLVDLDPQAHLTRGLGLVPEELTRTVYGAQGLLPGKGSGLKSRPGASEDCRCEDTSDKSYPKPKIYLDMPRRAA